MLTRNDYIALLICVFTILTLHSINVWHAGVYVSPNKFIAMNIVVMVSVFVYGAVLYFLNSRKQRKNNDG